MAEEIKLSVDEVVKLVMEAQSLQDLDRRLHSEEEAKALTESLSKPENSLSLDYVYKAAQELGIERSYIQSAINKRYPSIEEQLEDLKGFEAKPSRSVIHEMYTREILRALKSEFPSSDFEIDTYDDAFYRIEREEKGGFLGRKKFIAKRTKLASLSINEYHNFITLGFYNPIFPNICKSAVEKVNRRLHFHTRAATYFYKVD